MRTTEPRTHLPIAAGVAFLGLGFILIGALAEPRAEAQAAPPANLEALDEDALATLLACEKF